MSAKGGIYVYVDEARRGGGVSYTLVVQRDDTIWNIKQMLYPLCGIEVRDQVLSHKAGCGAELANPLSLQFYNLFRNNVRISLSKRAYFTPTPTPSSSSSEAEGGAVVAAARSGKSAASSAVNEQQQQQQRGSSAL